MNSPDEKINPNNTAEYLCTEVGASPGSYPHVTVCICTYKRPRLLKKLLYELCRQETGGMLSYSVVVTDNDEARSAEAIVAEMMKGTRVKITYGVEPRRGIALARNRALQNADGDYLALIDDDEFPAPDWLLSLLNACNKYEADGVLGSVIRRFEQKPPAWIQKGKFFERPTGSSGAPVDWNDSRTSNVFMRSRVIEGDPLPFRPEFRSGEDKDFFGRKISEGYSFIWSPEAVVYEVVPPARWRRRYLVKRSLLQGACEIFRADSGWVSKAKSLVAIPLYGVVLPLSLFFGQHHFMAIVEKVSYHAGKLLMSIGVNPVGEAYVSEGPNQ